MKSTTSRAAIKQPAAILAVMIFVDARIKAIPQNDDPRSGRQKREKKQIKAIVETIMVVTKSSSYESYKIEDHTIKRGCKRGSTGPSC